MISTGAQVNAGNTIHRKRERKQKTDRQDAQHILHLLLKDDFPQIWVPSGENRDLRQLLWHRHRMVQARTRMMNQLQAVALNEGLRCKKKLWREVGRKQLEAFRLAPWASRRRHDLLELLDRLNPTIAALSQAIEQEVEKCPEAQRLMTHPGVGPLYYERALVGMAEPSTRAKWRALRSARVSTPKKYLTGATLSERQCYANPQLVVKLAIQLVW